MTETKEENVPATEPEDTTAPEDVTASEDVTTSEDATGDAERDSLLRHVTRWGKPASATFLYCSMEGLALAIAYLAYALWQTVTGGGAGESPWEPVPEFVPVLMFAMGVMLSLWVARSHGADDIPSPSDLAKLLLVLRATVVLDVILVVTDKVAYGGPARMPIPMLLLGLIPATACWASYELFHRKTSELSTSHQEGEDTDAPEDGEPSEAPEDDAADVPETDDPDGGE